MVASNDWVEIIQFLNLGDVLEVYALCKTTANQLLPTNESLQEVEHVSAFGHEDHPSHS